MARGPAHKKPADRRTEQANNFGIQAFVSSVHTGRQEQKVLKFALVFADEMNAMVKCQITCSGCIVQNMNRFSCKTVFLSIFTLCGLFLLLACGWAASGDGRAVGGACSYKTYAGRATIVSISKAPQDNRNQSARFDVRFSFESSETIEERFVKLDGRTFSLYDESFRHPDETFLKTHELSVGKVLPGSVLVIKKGTCTPVLFDFPTLKSQK